MHGFRRKFVVSFFFCLVTIGQGYPFATAYAIGQEHAQCQCNQAGRKCIHGCDLKKHKSKKIAAAVEKSPCHQGVSRTAKHTHQQHAPLQVAKNDSDSAQWVSPACSRQHQQKVLSFQSDPFLLKSVQWVPTGVLFKEMRWTISQPTEVFLACDEHPPKKEDPADV